MIVRVAATEKSRNRFWYVSRNQGRTWHAVLHVRRNHQNRWLCDCRDFLFRRFAMRRHCRHIKELREILKVAKGDEKMLNTAKIYGRNVKVEPPIWRVTVAAPDSLSHREIMVMGFDPALAERAAIRSCEPGSYLTDLSNVTEVRP